MKVLSDKSIEQYLKSLNYEGLKDFQVVLHTALLEYKDDESIIPPRIVTKRGKATHIFMPLVGSQVGIKTLTGTTNGFKGAVTILDDIGNIRGILNATVLTAFRTALCSTLPLSRVFHSSGDRNLKGTKILVFGVGLQAYWHIRLTLTMYPDQFVEVVVCNRTLSKAETFCENLSKEFPDIKFNSLALDDEVAIEAACLNISIIYGCLPSTNPVILKRYVDNCQNGSLYISVIGSYQPQMTEVDGLVIKEILQGGGRIIVDSKEHASHEAGELIQNMVPIGKLVEVSEYTSSEDISVYKGSSKIVLCKLVGLSIMDVAIGSKLIDDAEKRNDGISVDI
ncbi:uncharacterized protein PRCAT00005020001 [Priceomyces carsonii]|uniref:uncharacterized protein n=1 Tax=Priceomyces carsonii TaxID=28549 RepID=UPI002EDAA252|nr:unnamed protein product [Priceomyces carsonii]